MDFHSMIGKLRAIESLGVTKNYVAEEETTNEDSKCTMTAEGESCPVHGLTECPMVPMEEGDIDVLKGMLKNSGQMSEEDQLGDPMGVGNEWLNSEPATTPQDTPAQPPSTTPAVATPTSAVRPSATAAGMPAATTDTSGGVTSDPTYKPKTAAPTPAAPAPATPAAPTPTTFNDAFRAARKEAGGAGGVFMWKGKPYQTNVKGETAKAWNSPELKKVGSGWPAAESAVRKIKSPRIAETSKLDELSPATLQSYANKAKRDYNDMNVWADEEGMGTYRDRMKKPTQDDLENPFYSDKSKHWSTERQTKRVKGLKLAKARGIVPARPGAGKKISAAARAYNDSRGRIGGGYRGESAIGTNNVEMQESLYKMRRLAGLGEMIDDSAYQDNVDEMATDMTIEDLMRKYGVDDDSMQDEGFQPDITEDDADDNDNGITGSNEVLKKRGVGPTMHEDAPLVGAPFTPLGATNNGPEEWGMVVTGGTDTNNFEESVTINSNMDIRDGKVTKSLSINATDEDVDSLAAMLRNAGMGDQVGVVKHVEICDGCRQPVDQCRCGMALENADHDYGNEENSSEGEPVDAEEYIWDGAHLNQRFGKIGDNTLMAERAISLFKNYSKEYSQILSEAELETSNSGADSPLTANNRDEFDKDPFVGDDTVDDGTHSPLSTVKRQDVMN